MKNVKQVLAGFYILISVFSFLSLSGCEHWGWRDRDDRHGNYEERGERGGEQHHGENRGESR